MSKTVRSGWLVCCVVAVLTGLAPVAAGEPAASATDATSSETSDGGAPRLEFAALEHDFGETLAGKPLTTTFRFKNAGDGVLVIEKVKGT